MPPYGMQQTGVQPAEPPVYPSTGFGVYTPGSDHGQTPMMPPAGVQMPFPQTEKSGPLLMQPPEMAGHVEPPENLGFFSRMARTGTVMLAPRTINANAGHEVDESLVFTGRFLGGIRDDIKRRAPFWISDWTDALASQNRSQALASVIFLFFACISPALTFGMLYQELTDGQLGVVETLLSTGVSGVIYSIFSGQPICIMGATGPEFAYTVVVWNLCKQMNIPFLAARFWQGLWTALFTVLLAGFDLCFLMKYVTRFTEEIFAAFITMTFILGAFLNTLKLYDDTTDIGRARAFGGTLLVLGTFQMATSLKTIKAGNTLNPSLRAMLSNYGVVIAIFVFSILNYVFKDLKMATLDVPTEFAPTYIEPHTLKARSWIVNPMGSPEQPMQGWAIGFTALPALGLTLLGYMDQNVSTLIVNRKDHMLKKGPAYHLDLMVCGVFLYPICAFFGLPFPHASTVPCLIHLISLSTRETVHMEGGGTTTRVTSVIEGARTTNMLIHLLILLSLLFTSVLQLIPKTVLYGVFLFMGVGSIAGNELFDRLHLFCIWVTKDYPQYEYTKNVALWTMHSFTLFQVAMLAILYVTTLISDLSIAFPFFIGALVPIRWAMARVWSPEDLKWLDA